jgi:hypothetical protein
MRHPDYLEGACDIHVHSAPDIDPRRYDDFELAREAARAGMAAILIKSHQNSTVERAILASKAVADVQVFGGLVLNRPVGGLNPEAVRVALALGARQIWMPTRSAANHRRFYGQDDGAGIGILDGEGALLPPVAEILDLIAPTGCVLGTGHLSPDESCVLIAEARRRGVRNIVVTHPEWQGTYFPFDLQVRLAAAHGVLFERCYVSTTHRCGFTPMKTIAGGIAAAGPETTILATDLGQPDTPPPAEGLRLYAEQLRAFGFTPDQLRRMAVENPARLLGLSPQRQLGLQHDPLEPALRSLDPL